MRMRWPRPDQPRKYRLPRPRLPWSGQSLFWQQKCSMGCCWSADIIQLLDHPGLGDSSLLPYSTHRLCALSRHYLKLYCLQNARVKELATLVEELLQSSTHVAGATAIAPGVVLAGARKLHQ